MYRYVVLLLLLVGCAAKPPNDPICFQDGLKVANCTYMVVGQDFKVDNVGHKYQLNGHQWNFDELQQNTLWLPPETYADIKTFFLNYCHQNSGVCNYEDIQAQFIDFEDAHPKLKKVIYRK